MVRTGDNFITSLINNSNSFLGLGAIPLQSVKDTIDELNYLVHDLGFKGIQISIFVGDRGIWVSAYYPIHELANRYELFILLHPNAVKSDSMLGDYYQINLIGNPPYATIAISYLIIT